MLSSQHNRYLNLHAQIPQPSHYLTHVGLVTCDLSFETHLCPLIHRLSVSLSHT